MAKPSNLLIGRKIKGKKFVAGKVHDADDKNISNVKAIELQMAQNSTIPAVYENKNTTHQSAENILNALNCSFEEGDRYFSLLADQTDKEVIENPNIIDDLKWEDLTNTDISATDKFPEATDNFYVLDEALPQIQNRKDQKNLQRRSFPGALELANDLIKTNLQNSYTKTLPQFKGK
jgi:hypothetical protein